MFVTDVIFRIWSQLEGGYSRDFLLLNLNVKFTSIIMILLTALILLAGTKTNSLASSLSFMFDTRNRAIVLLGVKCCLKCCIRISFVFITELKKKI